MKKTAILLVVLLLFCGLFVGCRTTVSRSDIQEYLERRFPGQAFTLGPNAETIEEQSGYWAASFVDTPDVTFYVYGSRGGLFAGGPTEIHYYDNYDTVFSEYYYGLYIEGTDKSSRDALRFAMHGVAEPFQFQYGFRGSYNAHSIRSKVFIPVRDRTEIAGALHGLAAFSNYVQNSKHPCLLRFFVQFQYAIEEGSVHTVWQAVEDAGNVAGDGTLALLQTAFFENAIDLQLGLEQFTQQEILDYTKAHGGITLYRESGETIFFEDLLPRPYHEVSFGTFYTLLQRTGISVQGGPGHFWFTGLDGSKYEFSYSFLGMREGMMDEYTYYYKDGEKQWRGYNYPDNMGEYEMIRMAGFTLRPWEESPAGRSALSEISSSPVSGS